MRVLIQQNAVGGIAPHLAVVFGSALELGKLFLFPWFRSIVHLSLYLLVIVVWDIVDDALKNLLLIKLLNEVILFLSFRYRSCIVQTPTGSTGQSLGASLTLVAYRTSISALLTSGIRASFLKDCMLTRDERAFLVVGLKIKWVDWLWSIYLIQIWDDRALLIVSLKILWIDKLWSVELKLIFWQRLWMRKGSFLS